METDPQNEALKVAKMIILRKMQELGTEMRELQAVLARLEGGTVQAATPPGSGKPDVDKPPQSPA